MFEGDMLHVFMTSSEDGFVKIWDRRTNAQVAQVKTYTNAPMQSLSSSSSLIAAGTNEDIFLWDIHNLAKPIGHFQECHNDDVTGIAFSKDGTQFISCSVDYVLNMFNLSQSTQKKGYKEDEVIDGAYSCLQPMNSCGFVSEQIIWAMTTINTVEFIRKIDAVCFLRVDKVRQLSFNLLVSARCLLPDCS